MSATNVCFSKFQQVFEYTAKQDVVLFKDHKQQLCHSINEVLL